MLQLTIPRTEYWDEEKQEFSYENECHLQLEHSLVSISKWESVWQKPFLNSTNLTDEEVLDYIKCMTITQNVSPKVYSRLTKENINQINTYIGSPMTATTFSEIPGESNSREIITSEIIYYWMVTFNIPFECQKWHIHRLLALIKVCNLKNQPERKMTQTEILQRQRQLNEERKKKYNTAG